MRRQAGWGREAGASSVFCWEHVPRLSTESSPGGRSLSSSPTGTEQLAGVAGRRGGLLVAAAEGMAGGDGGARAGTPSVLLKPPFRQNVAVLMSVSPPLFPPTFRACTSSLPRRLLTSSQERSHLTRAHGASAFHSSVLTYAVSYGLYVSKRMTDSLKVWTIRVVFLSLIFLSSSMVVEF